MGMREHHSLQLCLDRAHRDLWVGEQAFHETLDPARHPLLDGARKFSKIGFLNVWASF